MRPRVPPAVLGRIREDTYQEPREGGLRVGAPAARPSASALVPPIRFAACSLSHGRVAQVEWADLRCPLCRSKVGTTSDGSATMTWIPRERKKPRQQQIVLARKALVMWRDLEDDIRRCEKDDDATRTAQARLIPSRTAPLVLALTPSVDRAGAAGDHPPLGRRGGAQARRSRQGVRAVVFVRTRASSDASSVERGSSAATW